MPCGAAGRTRRLRRFTSDPDCRVRLRRRRRPPGGAPMMLAIVFLLSCLSLLIWIVLLAARG
ncbi:hypothetical protein, partial [Burkholderia ubonensis]|uniref:hypothetical protein n=1 Tax=Burkholderia ubonensis TaxID=101571 RepID=UPI00052566B4